MKRIIPYLLVALVILIAYWQVAFLKQTLKYDILDGYLPGHYFVSECLRNNVFPLWNPYIQLGFPIYADLTNTNYLVNLFIAKIFPYTNITFHFLFIIYVIIGGWGVYRLSRLLKVSPNYSLLISISYSLSGFFTGNAQHIQFIISAAWLPVTLFFFIKLSKELKIQDTLLFVIFAYLLFSGGYPSIAILFAYILILLYVYWIWNFIRQKKFRQAFRYSGLCLSGALLLALLCFGIFISILQSSPHVSRYTGLDYEYSITNAFPPESLISLISPLTTVTNSALFRTDISMSNHYFGVIILILFFNGLFSKLNKKSVFILIAGLTCLLLSFGDHFFLHKLLYNSVPLFDKFRHPSSFRIFTILFFLLFTGIQLSRYDPSQKSNVNKFARIYLAFISILLVLGFICLIIILRKALGPVDFQPKWNAVLTHYGISGPLFIQITIILLLNSVFIYFLFLRKKVHFFYPGVILLLVVEMIIFTQLNLNYTVTSKWNPKEIRAFLKNTPKGFPLPDQHLLADNTDESVSNFPLGRNTNTYAKTVSPYARYPFYLERFNTLKADSHVFKNSVENRLLYFCDTVVNNFTDNLVSNKSYVFIEDSVFIKYVDKSDFKQSQYDTIECVKFSPSEMKFRSRSKTNQFAILLQNDYPGWKVYIDNVLSKHFTVNHSLIGFNLPGGDHEILFKFENTLYVRATIFAFILFAFILTLVFVLKARESLRKRMKYLYFAGIILILICIAIGFKEEVPFDKVNKHNNLEIKEYLLHKYDHDKANTLVLLNTESYGAFKEIGLNNVIYKRFRFSSDVTEIHDILDTLKTGKLTYVWSNVLEPPGTRELIQMHFPDIVNEYYGNRFAVIEYSKKDTYQWNKAPYYLNNYELLAKEFTSDGILTDSTNVYSGKYSEKLSGERLFSSTFRKSLDGSGINVFTQVRFMKPETKSCHLVITITRKNKTLYYDAVDLESFNENGERWNTGFMAKSFLKSSIRRGDELVVYCWNSGNNKTLYLDDFFVKVN